MKLAGTAAWGVAAAMIACASTSCTPATAPAAGRPNLTSAAAAFRLIQEPEDGYRFATDLIAHATRSVRMTFYELADPSVTAALVDAAQRNISVKVILDSAFHGRRTNENAYNQLHSAGIAVRWAPTDVIYHQKTFAVDDTAAAISTANLNPRYYPSSRDAVIVTTDHRDVTAITATFDADFAATNSSTQTPPAATQGPNLIWSPGAETAFLQQIRSATTSLDLTTEELTDHDVIAAITTDARRGVACRIVMTSNPASKRGLAQTAAAGCSVHLMPATASQLYIHEKAILTDHASLLIGSQNLSPTSLTENRELSIQLDSATATETVAAVQATFEHDYQNAPTAPNSNR